MLLRRARACVCVSVAHLAAHGCVFAGLQFVSAGEDAVVNVWTLPERSTGSYKVRSCLCLQPSCCSLTTGLQVELAASKLVEDHLFTGVQFFKSPRLAILAASYDNNVMVLLQ